MKEPIERIELKEAIAALRTELNESVIAAQNEQLLFEVQQITMEFQIEVERDYQTEGSIKFLLAELGAGGTAKNKEVQKLVILLRPHGADGEPIAIAGRMVPR